MRLCLYHVQVVSTEGGGGFKVPVTSPAWLAMTHWEEEEQVRRIYIRVLNV